MDSLTKTCDECEHDCYGQNELRSIQKQLVSYAHPNSNIFGIVQKVAYNNSLAHPKRTSDDHFIDAERRVLEYVGKTPEFSNRTDLEKMFTDNLSSFAFGLYRSRVQVLGMDPQPSYDPIEMKKQDWEQAVENLSNDIMTHTQDIMYKDEFEISLFLD